MGKVIWKVVLFLLPVLCVIGLLRMSLGADPDEFLPSYETLLKQFASMPDFTQMVRDAVDTFNTTQAQMVSAWSNIDSLDTLFLAIGSFFMQFYNGLLVVVACVSIPFRWFGWFFNVIFTIHSPVVY